MKAERIDEPSDTVEAGYVIKQTPHAKVKVTENSTILLHVSEGKKEAKDVPELLGESLSTARKLIDALELELSVTEREDAENVGKVISQSPLAGEKILPGETIKVVVGIEPAVPSPSPTPSEKPTRKTLTIQIPDTAGETVQIKVVANGRTIYEKVHKKAEGTVDIPVEARNDATVQVYMDGQFMFEKVIEF